MELTETSSKRQILSVTELTRNIRYLLEENFPAVWVEGEVSGYKLATSGHIYFDLKDESSKIKCAFFRSSNQSLRFQLQDGLKIIAFGKVSVYEPRGDYQLYVELVEPKGIGALQLAFEEMKARLLKEGLFDSAHKKPIPYLPGRIGIVTSPTGAVIRDILHILDRRFSKVHILIYPVQVQGTSAKEEIARAIEDFNRLKNVDVLILARGGGSLEDLWAFNEERVARAIYASQIPVISAIGHEVDYTIADFVADLRAPTPSAAAELVLPLRSELEERLLTFQNRLYQNITGRLNLFQSRLKSLAESYVLKQPLNIIKQYVQRMDEFRKTLDARIEFLLKMGSERIRSLSKRLEGLNPLAVLDRGYSITFDVGGRVIRKAGEVKRGEKIITRLSWGRMESSVDKVEGE